MKDCPNWPRAQQRLNDVLAQGVRLRLEKAIGGAYEMPDGRKFWVDDVVAREIVNRINAALRTTGESNDAS